MRDWAAEKLEICDWANPIAYCSLFWPAPTRPCTRPRFATAVLIELIAASALPITVPVWLGAVMDCAPAAVKTPVNGFDVIETQDLVVLCAVAASLVSRCERV